MVSLQSPGSDVNTSSIIKKEENQSDLQHLKLTLILGITLMTLIILVTLVAFCVATLFKLKNLSSKRSKSQYSVNPELAALSYFHPSIGVSDTSFSNSAESSMWDTSSSDLRKSTSRKLKSQNTSDLTSTGSEDSGVNDQLDSLISEESIEEISIDK
ncbi:Acrosome formation-associated factor [Heterocephalus glaber]|uniref:Acrosome formation-associated factor n=1 Tax=Heterocephalus glaber TaxID=10181 RepID=G5BPW9_HETGA|nr:Acrosome formation-associated factor [Heterocephalus glaber]